METHRFIRKALVESTNDRYDLNLRYTTQVRTATEYWTNGTTTLLSIPQSKRLQNPSITHTNPLDSSSYQYSESKNCDRMPEIPMKPAISQPSSNAPNNLIRNSLIAGSASGMASTVTW